MNRRTLILSHLVDAAKNLDELREAMTHAYVLIEERRGDEAASARMAIDSARDAAYAPALSDLIERAITTVGRMP